MDGSRSRTQKRVRLFVYGYGRGLQIVRSKNQNYIHTL